MGLRDEARSISRRPGPQTTTILRIIASLDGDERDDVIGLIWDDADVTSSRAAAEILTKHFGATFGSVSDQQVRNHRQKVPRP